MLQECYDQWKALAAGRVQRPGDANGVAARAAMLRDVNLQQLRLIGGTEIATNLH